MSGQARAVQVEPGDVLPELRFGPITRAMLALYAGVSGDHDPVHIDIDFARQAGLDDVFAHGMLTFGVLSGVVSRWRGIERLRAFEARFVSIVHVRDVISCSATVIECFEAPDGRRARITLLALTQDGRRALTGEAIVSLE